MNTTDEKGLKLFLDDDDDDDDEGLLGVDMDFQRKAATKKKVQNIVLRVQAIKKNLALAYLLS